MDMTADPPVLTSTEYRVLELYVEGFSPRAIATQTMIDRVDVDLILVESCGSDRGRAQQLLVDAIVRNTPPATDLDAVMAAHTDPATTVTYTQPPKPLPLTFDQADLIGPPAGRHIPPDTLWLIPDDLAGPIVLERWRTHRCPVCRYTGPAAGHTGRCGPVERGAVTITLADGSHGWPPSHVIVGVEPT